MTISAAVVAADEYGRFAFAAADRLPPADVANVTASFHHTVSSSLNPPLRPPLSIVSGTPLTSRLSGFRFSIHMVWFVNKFGLSAAEAVLRRAASSGSGCWLSRYIAS